MILKAQEAHRGKGRQSSKAMITTWCNHVHNVYAVRDCESPEKDRLTPSWAGGEAAQGRYPSAERSREQNGVGMFPVKGTARAKAQNRSS